MLVSLGLLLFAGPIPAASAAEFGIAPDGFSVRLLDADGNPENRAGSHPDRLRIDFELETEGTGTSLGDLAVEMPPGFGGDPGAVPACPRQAHEEGEECPPESQVGVVSFGPAGDPLPIFLLEPEPDQVAAFTSESGLPIPFKLKLRPDDFGVTFAAEDIAEGGPSEAHIEFWGTPAQHQSDPVDEPRPFLTTPSDCGPLDFTLRARSREEGAPWLSASTEAGPLTGCEDLAFSPRFGLRMSTLVADSPTGVGMTLSLPREEGAELAGAQMRDVSIELPSGLTVSPGAAAGLTFCTDSQLGLGNDAPVACPAAARVGTVEMTSSVLLEPLVGAVYFGEGKGEERFPLFIVAPGPGFVFKFATGLEPDADSGRIVAALRDLPPVAIDQIALSLNGGPTGLLATPLACGPARGEARFTPYGGGASVVSTATVAIAGLLPGSACPGPLSFAPRLSLSTSSRKAGRPIAFSATLRRKPGEALSARFAMTLPAGLSTALGAIEECPESLAASGECPASSRVGSARAEAGSGSNPAGLSGAAYLAGPYRRAPFSLVMAFQAQVGPFDLGTVTFRAAARIDGRSGRVTVATDRLPSVVAGIPIRFQTIELALDRPGLVRNPTSCAPRTLDAEFESQEGAIVSTSTPYEVDGCRRLGFAPRMRATLLKRGRLHEHDPVGLRVSARFRRTDTSLRSLALSLPPDLTLNVGGLEEICSRPDARRGLCPPGAKVGSSRARTPLLAEPLVGSVYVVRPRGNGEPDLWTALAGGGVELAMKGTTSNEGGRFLTRIAGLPDVPLESFSLRLGGPNADLLSFDSSPCRDGRPRRLETELRVRGQNGARRISRLAIPTGARCGSAARR